MTVRELIEKLQALEDWNMEIVVPSYADNYHRGFTEPQLEKPGEEDEWGDEHPGKIVIF